MSDPIAAVRIAYDRDHDVGEAALRGMRIELSAWLTDEIYACNALLHEGQVRGSGYLRSWRWRVGCRLLARLERVWPPELADERELKQFVHRVTRFLERTAQEPSRAARPARATTSD
jgi:hypothetical protein